MEMFPIDHDPEAQEAAIRRIVTLLHATYPLGRSEGVVAKSRRHVLEAVESYRAAVVGLVLEGRLDVDQGQQLNATVDRILREEMGPWPTP